MLGVQTNKNGNYDCVVSDACGVVTSVVATLTVTLPPSITAQPHSQIVPVGSNAAFSVTAGPGTFPAYNWLLNGWAFGDVTNYYTLFGVPTNKAGAYSVVLSNSCGVLTSSVAWLTVVMPLANQIAT